MRFLAMSVQTPMVITFEAILKSLARGRDCFLAPAEKAALQVASSARDSPVSLPVPEPHAKGKTMVRLVPSASLPAPEPHAQGLTMVREDSYVKPQSRQDVRGT